MANHFAIDLETLAQNPNAVVLSLGIVCFDYFGSDIKDSFYVKFDIKQQVKEFKRDVDKDTLAWWKKQSKDSQSVVQPSAEDVSCLDALTKLNIFLKDNSYDKDNSFMWSRGIDFDFPILYSLYDHVGIKPAWNCWRVRDIRTLLEVQEIFAQAAGIEFDFSDIGKNNHDSLDDARCDATRIQRMWKLFL